MEQTSVASECIAFLFNVCNVCHEFTKPAKNEFECHSLRKHRCKVKQLATGKGDFTQDLALSGLGNFPICERGKAPCLICKHDFPVVSINTTTCCNNVTGLSGKQPSVCTFQKTPSSHKKTNFWLGRVLKNSLPPQLVSTEHLS